MAKIGIIKTVAGGYFDMGDGSYSRNASKYEIIEETIANKVVYYITQLEAIEQASTDTQNWIDKNSRVQDGAKTSVYIGSTLEGAINKECYQQAFSWVQPLQDVA